MANFEISGYELYELLGRGGMATVYRALHLNLDREVAIKVMDTSLNTDETFSERFIREARISARLIHPHILQIYDVNSFDTLNYISMELMEGGDLADSIRGAMKQSTIYHVMGQMTQALDYAASKGYVHRDIKPSNIMLRAENDFVLADFGIAKAANSGTQMTQTGLMVGTPSYMSPEQARGVEVDGRSDLYGLAVLCYEMLTKELPYDADSAVSTAVKHLTQDIPTLSGALAAYQPFMDKALAKEADDRFQTGREMFLALCDVRDQFADDAVLTQPKEPSEADKTGPGFSQDLHTSVAWDEATRVVAPSRPSRPYKLSDTADQEALVSGIRGEQRTSQRPPASSVGRIFRGLLILVIVGASAFGGYRYWQGQQSSIRGNVRSLTSELAQAYGALNENELNRAAIAFRKVLAVDGNHAAARRGLSDVEVSYVAAIDEAMNSDNLKEAQRLLVDYSLMFSGSGDVDRLHAALEEAKQAQKLRVAKSERMDAIVKAANAALERGDLFTPPEDNAYEKLQQATALDPDNGAPGEIVVKLMAAAAAGVYALIDESRFEEAGEQLDRIRQIDPNQPVLVEASIAMEQAVADERARAQEAQGRQQTLDAAGELFAKGQFERAGAMYADVLTVESDSATAAKGYANAIAAIVAKARVALEENNFANARADLAAVAKLAPDNDAATQLSAQLPVLEQAWQQQQARIAEERERVAALAERGMTAVAIGDLEMAAQTYGKLADSHPEFEETLALKNHLSAAYIEAAREEISAEQFDAALESVGRGQLVAPDAPAWAELREQIELSRANSRRLGAY